MNVSREVNLSAHPFSRMAGECERVSVGHTEFGELRDAAVSERVKDLPLAALLELKNEPCPRLAGTVAVSVPAVLELREDSLVSDGLHVFEEAEFNEKVRQRDNPSRLRVLQRLVLACIIAREVEVRYAR